MSKRQKDRQYNVQKTEGHTTMSLSFCLLDIVLFVLLSFGHCIVCPSVFWPLYCLSFCLFDIVLSVLLSFGHCIICLSVFWPLYYLSFCYNGQKTEEQIIQCPKDRRTDNTMSKRQKDR
jgi:hypothetical protein